MSDAEAVQVLSSYITKTKPPPPSVAAQIIKDKIPNDVRRTMRAMGFDKLPPISVACAPAPALARAAAAPGKCSSSMPHRDHIPYNLFPFNACVARPVDRAERNKTPAAQAAIKKNGIG